MLTLGGFLCRFGRPSSEGFFGPFFGQPTTVPDSLPIQRLSVFDSDVIEVYHSPTNQRAPIVAFRPGGSNVLWAVVAHGFRTNDVESIQFEGARAGSYWTRSITGRVVWTYGDERAIWLVDRAGRLCGYFFDY